MFLTRIFAISSFVFLFAKGIDAFLAAKYDLGGLEDLQTFQQVVHTRLESMAEKRREFDRQEVILKR
jgi:hypothetical protein